METKNEATAEAAVADAVVHPTDPPQPIEPVPQPQSVGDPSVEAFESPVDDDPSPEELQHLRAAALDEPGELIDIRESALEEIEIEIPVNIIPPSIGRKVWFRGANTDLDGQAEDATIVYVHSDHMVNLLVVSHNGVPRPETSIPLVHEGEERPENGHFAEWMPFQKGQARPASPGIPIARHVNVGDDVYFGRGDSHFYAAKVTEINEDRTVDLIVFERERSYHVFGINKADLDQPGCINGWAFKA
jgi:hypothetical protein